jgi:hypothetical protein
MTRERLFHRVDLISDALPFGCLWYTQVSHAIGYAEFYSRSHDAVIRVYESASHGRHMRSQLCKWCVDWTVRNR